MSLRILLNTFKIDNGMRQMPVRKGTKMRQMPLRMNNYNEMNMKRTLYQDRLTGYVLPSSAAVVLGNSSLASSRKGSMDLYLDEK